MRQFARYDLALTLAIVLAFALLLVLAFVVMPAGAAVTTAHYAGHLGRVRCGAFCKTMAGVTRCRCVGW